MTASEIAGWGSGGWREKAACQNRDTELFFPIGNTGPARDQIDKAKAVCAECDVVNQCLFYALETGQEFGVWGGLSEDERRELKKRERQRRMREEIAAKATRPWN